MANLSQLWSLPQSLRDMVENETEEGETLLWVAQPRPGRMAMRMLPLVLFAIPFTGFAIFWITMALTMGGEAESGDGGNSETLSLMFPLFGLPFVLVGLGMLSSPLWALRNARKTVYAITDRRAIIFDSGLSMKIRSYGPDELGELTRKQKPDGSGDIILDEKITRDSDGDAHTRKIGFFGIPDVKEVERMLRDLAAAHA